MKYLSIFVFSLSLLFAGCSTSTPTTPTIVVSTIPLYSMTTSLVGNTYDVELLVPAGASVHTWSPKPSDIESIHNASYVIINGVIDHQVEELLHDIPEEKVINMTELLTKRNAIAPEETEDKEHEEDHEEEHDEDHEEDEHYHGEVNPHYWLSPGLVREQIAILEETFGEETKENAVSFLQEFDTRVEQVRQQIAQIPGKPFLDFHDAYGYFYDFTGIEEFHKGSIEPFPGKEPTPQYLQELYKSIEEYQITIMFTEPQLASSMTERLKEQGVVLYSMNPLGTNASPDALFDIYTSLGNSLFVAFSN